jgi:hypothetical protein
VTLAQLNLPSKSFWDGLVPVQWTSVGVLAFFICYDAVRSVNYAVQSVRIREYDKDLRAALGAVLVAVVGATGAPWDEVAVRYYRRRGRLFWRRLVPLAAVRAGADDAEAHISVRPSAGVVGSAFSGQELIAVEWRDFVRVATEEGVAAWDQRAKKNRYGLRWGQMRRSPQHEGVVANPTFAPNGQPDGCIMLNGPLKSQDLISYEVRQALDSFSGTLDQLGSPPKGWWGAHGR